MKKVIARLAVFSLVTFSIGPVPAMETEEASAQGAFVVNFGRDGGGSCGFTDFDGFRGSGHGTSVSTPSGENVVACTGSIDQTPPNRAAPSRAVRFKFPNLILVINPTGGFHFTVRF